MWLVITTSSRHSVSLGAQSSPIFATQLPCGYLYNVDTCTHPFTQESFLAPSSTAHIIQPYLTSRRSSPWHPLFPFALYFLLALSCQMFFNINDTLLIDINHPTPATAQASTDSIRYALAATAVVVEEGEVTDEVLEARRESESQGMAQGPTRNNCKMSWNAR